MNQSARNHSIDAFRVIANWSVVWNHSDVFVGPAFSPAIELLGQLINQSIRGATAFFFLTSGYFFATHIARGSAPVSLAVKQIRRLAMFAVFWSCVYVLLPIVPLLKSPDAGYWSALMEQLAGVKAALWHAQILFTGTEIHLWFLPALACALSLLAFAVHFKVERPVAAFTVALFLFGLAAGAYHKTPFGIHFGFNTRNGPFYSSIFVFTGFMIHRLQIKVTTRRALALLALSVALRIAEQTWLTRAYGVQGSEVDYLLGTYPFGVGLFLLLLSAPRLGEITWMTNLARYSAGVYCAHMLFVNLLTTQPLAVGNIGWEIVRPFLALALTYTLVISTARVQVLKPLLT